MDYGNSKGPAINNNMVPERETEVSREMDRLHSVISEYAAMAESLLTRLNGVLRNVLGAKTGGINDPVPQPSTSLGSSIADVVSKTIRANDVLNDILNRLEV